MGAMIAGVAISVIASAIAGQMGADAQEKAANIIKSATEQEKQELQSYYDQQFGAGSYNNQIQQLGMGAMNSYNDLVKNADWDRFVDGADAYVAPEAFKFTAEDLNSDPSYKFRLQQAQDALAQNQVAAGLNLSGAAAKEMSDRTSDYASQEYANAYNRAYTNYSDKVNRDYTSWKDRASMFTNNLNNQLSALAKEAGWGVQANETQGQAFGQLAQAIAQLTGQGAQASAYGSTAGQTAAANTVNNAGQLIGSLVASYTGKGQNTSYGNTPTANQASATISGWNQALGNSDNVLSSGNVDLNNLNSDQVSEIVQKYLGGNQSSYL